MRSAMLCLCYVMCSAFGVLNSAMLCLCYVLCCAFVMLCDGLQVCAMPHHNFLCPHGQLNIRTLQTVQNMFIQVPPAMWSALQQNYSGVALSASNWHTCSECEEVSSTATPHSNTTQQEFQ